MSARKAKATISGEPITYWRSIDNRRRTKDYLDSLKDEFNNEANEITAMDRRSMLKVMGASIALSGLGVSCRRPVEKILPYVHQPHEITPGIPNYYATAQRTPFGAQPLLVESHEGRPTKIEGNNSHPESLGKASIINQASVLELYDPDRSRYVSKKSQQGRVPAQWSEWDAHFAHLLFDHKKTSGDGLAIVCDSDISPTFLRLKEKVKARYPKAKFYVHEPMRQKNIEDATAMVYGKGTRVSHDFSKARMIASIFADPFSFGPENILNQNGFSNNRNIHNKSDVKKMNRLYAIEADFSLASVNADNRLKLPVGLAHKFVLALAYELLASHEIDLDLKISEGISLSALVKRPPSLRGIDKNFLRNLSRDLAYNRGRALLVGGDHLPKATLAMIHVLNEALNGKNRVTKVLRIDDELAINHLDEGDIHDFIKDVEGQKIKTAIFAGVNPAYNAPSVLKFEDSLDSVKETIHCGLYEDETAKLCDWHVPMTHFLEHFADCRSYRGVVSIVQPLIRPLHGARSKLEFFAKMAEVEKKNPYKLVKETIKNKYLVGDKDKAFDQAVHDGLVKNSGFKSLNIKRINASNVIKEFKKQSSLLPNKENIELLIKFDRKVLDGRYANHSWLQELPDPVNKLDWGNALLMSPRLAKELKIKSGLKKNAYIADIVEVSADNKSIKLPVFVMPGLNDYTIVATLGYGRTAAGAVGNNVGVDVYPLLKDYKNKVHHGVKITPTFDTYRLSSTQEQFAMNGEVVQEIDVLSMRSRDPARVNTVRGYKKNPDYAKEKGLPESLLVKEKNKDKKVPLQITKAWDYSKGNQWGMVIDLTKCTGCNACVVACQSENNIPVVGKEQVMRGRMMHWIRVDRYFIGDVNEPRSISQPVPCQHCENAPCEPVCPVAATVHDSEGLNAMVYNRCIGTRYCGNNCPYKVRRFNYFDFSHSGNLHVDKKVKERQKTLKLQRNPDVTVRYRGVMEKCTYCTQRIQEAKMKARREGEDPNNLKDGAVTPACAQSCPSDAIVFGNINDEDSKVSKLKSVNRNYTMLDILNSRPRTSYLSKLRNPNPRLRT